MSQRDLLFEIAGFLRLLGAGTVLLPSHVGRECNELLEKIGLALTEPERDCQSCHEHGFKEGEQAMLDKAISAVQSLDTVHGSSDWRSGLHQALQRLRELKTTTPENET